MKVFLILSALFLSITNSNANECKVFKSKVLYYACMNDLNNVKTEIKNGADINIEEHSYDVARSFMDHHNKDAIVFLLKKTNINLRKIYSNGETFIGIFSYLDLNMKETLSLYEFALNKVNFYNLETSDRGETALSTLIEFYKKSKGNHKEEDKIIYFLKKLIENGAKLNNKNCSSTVCQSYIGYMIENIQSYAVEELLQSWRKKSFSSEYQESVEYLLSDILNGNQPYTDFILIYDFENTFKKILKHLTENEVTTLKIKNNQTSIKVNPFYLFTQKIKYLSTTKKSDYLNNNLERVFLESLLKMMIERGFSILNY